MRVPEAFLTHAVSNLAVSPATEYHAQMVDPAPTCRLVAAGLVAFALLGVAGESAAQPFSTERRLGEPGENARVLWQRHSQVVFDGENYVAIWENERSTFAPFSGGWRFAARVSEDGTLLDEHAILLTRHSPSSMVVSAAAPWGTLIVLPVDDDIAAVRLGRGGEVFDSEPRVLVSGARNYPAPSVACLDTGCLLVHSSGDSSNPRTLGVALDGCGESVPGTEFELPSGTWEVRAASDGYVALGRTPASGVEAELVAIGMTADGRRRFEPVAIPAPRGVGTAFGSGPSGSLVVWSEPGAHEVRSACLDADGRLRDQALVLESAETVFVGGMSSEGDNYRLGLRIGTSTASLAVDGCGRPLEAPVVLASDDGPCTVGQPRVASGTHSTLFTWDFGINSRECEKPPATAAVLPHDPGLPLAPVEVQGAAARMGPPAIGSDGTTYLAAWYEDRDGASGLYTQALETDGTPRERAVLTIPSDAHPAPARSASVAFVGGRYVVELHASENSSNHESWREPNVAAEVEPRTLSRGEPRVQQKLGVPGSSSFLDVFGTVYQEGEDVRTLSYLTVRATDAARTPLSEDWNHSLTPGAGDSHAVAAFDGARFGVLWTHDEPRSPTSEAWVEQVFMTFDETGQPLLASPLVLPGLGEYEPASLTFGDGMYLLSLFARDRSLVVVRLTTEGELLDATPKPLLEAVATLTEGSSAERRFSGAIFDGEAFVFAWVERSTTGADMPPSLRHLDFDVRVARIAVDGSLLSDGWVTSSREDEIGLGGLASVGDGTSLLGYRRFDDDPAYVALRGFVRTLGTGECNTATSCSEDACDACCVRGCARREPVIACEVADCGTGCDEGTRCVSGLGCVSDAPAPTRVVRSEGCGCTMPGRDHGGHWALSFLLAALGARRVRPARRR